MSEDLESAEKTALVSKRVNEPVTLTPAWEATNVSEEVLNFTDLKMKDAHLQLNPPKDRFHLVYLTFVIHGIGVLMPWNMFITAKSYFMDYKLSKTYTGQDVIYLTNFMFYLQVANQLPNILFNWCNVFLRIGGNLSVRIVWSISALIILFLITTVMAMIDSSLWPNFFFWVTIASVIAIGTSSGIYQNTIYGLAAKLPSNYPGAIVLGCNISGASTSIINIVSREFTSNHRTAAIYYFITALLILLVCYDTYFALPLNKFYRFYEKKHEKEVQRSNIQRQGSIPYFKIFKKAFPQLFNVFFVFLITLSIFPTVHSEIKQSDPKFMFGGDMFMNVICFLSFNVSTVIGSYLATWVQWPKPEKLIYPILLRIIFVPLFLFCNYQPTNVIRTLPVLITNDWIYWGIAIVMAISSGYFSSLVMMCCPGTVDAEHASIASMFGAACLITGIFTGILTSYFWPIFVTLF